MTKCEIYQPITEMAEIELNVKRRIFARRLQNARKMCCLSQAELVANMKDEEKKDPQMKAVSTTAIERYENEIMYPETDAIMNTLAKVLDTTVESLTRPFVVEVDCSKFEFRKKSKLGKKAQDRIKLEIQQRIERYVEIERICGVEPHYDVDFSNVVVHDADDARNVAMMLREKWRLGMGPIVHPIEVMESHGIKIIEVSEDPTLFDGTSNVVEGIPVVVLNCNDEITSNSKHQNNQERRYLTAWHELGHKVMNIAADVNDKERENLCNVFANEMLIPTETFIKVFGRKRQMISSWELKDVQREYGISVRALMKKAEQLGVVTKNRYTWFCITLAKPENDAFRKQIDATAIQPQHSSRYSRLVYRALASGAINIIKASELLDMSEDIIRKSLDFDIAIGSIN